MLVLLVVPQAPRPPIGVSSKTLDTWLRLVTLLALSVPGVGPSSLSIEPQPADVSRPPRVVAGVGATADMGVGTDELLAVSPVSRNICVGAVQIDACFC